MKLRIPLTLLLLAASLPFAMNAQIRNNAGFRAKTVPRNDDGSAPAETLGWTLNFFGRLRSVAFVNNNGNITFDAPLSTFTPFGLTAVSREIIAPFFADVDTRPEGSNLVTYGSDTIDGRRAFGANYIDVGYYDRHVDKLNRFQVVLIQREDTGNGNFDIEFNYERISWETGDASGGQFGFGGVPASVGWSNGSGQPGTYYEFPGSLVPGSFLDGGAFSLVRGRTPGVVSQAGRWMFRARGGTIIPALTITTGCPVPNAVAGRPYTTRFEATGSKPPYRWSILADPDRPVANLSMSTAGVLSGTPTQLGTFEFTVRTSATDEDGEITLSRRCAITVDPPALTITTNSLLPTTVSGTRYEARFRTDTAPGTVRFDLLNSTAPPGLTLTPDGVLSGTPLGVGGQTIQVRARSDAATPAVKRFTLNVTPREVSVAGSCPLPNGTGGVPYEHRFEARGGIPPYRWSASGAPLPTGITLTEDGRLVGLPTVPHWWPFTVKVQDSRGTTAEQGCGVVILFPEIRVASACPLPLGTAGSVYSRRLEAAGGTGPYTWAVTGNLPQGLRLTSDGTISGTPTAVGASQFRVRVADARGQAAAAACSLTVAPGEYGVASCPLPNAYAGESYAQQLSASGGTGPFTWAEAAPLPAGLRVSRDGFLTGTLPNAGNFPVNLRVTDQLGRSATRSCSLAVLPQTLRFTNACPLPTATMGVNYSFQAGAAGGIAPYVFNVEGDLPPGLRISEAGLIVGTPTRSGFFPLALGLRDRSGQRTGVECGMFVDIPDFPDVRITGLPRTLAPAAAGPRFNVELSSAYPLAVDGEVKLTVTADTGSTIVEVNRPDPAIRLSNGQLTIPFHLDPNTRSTSVQIANTGTVASLLTASVGKIQVAGIDINRVASADSQLPRSIPVITNVCYVPTTDGLTIDISGYSTTRDLTSADLTFGANTFTAPLANAAGEYFASDESIRTGGTFRVRAPYRLTQGNARTLGQGTVVIRNSAGAAASRAIAACN